MIMSGRLKAELDAHGFKGINYTPLPWRTRRPIGEGASQTPTLLRRHPAYTAPVFTALMLAVALLASTQVLGSTHAHADYPYTGG